MTPEEIVQDFARRYNGTFVFVQEPNGDEEHLFKIDQVEGDATRLGVLHLSSNEVGRIKLNFGSAHTIKFIPAPVGVFQHQGKAYTCRRRPQRQFRRGICSDNTEINTVTYAFTRDRAGFSYELVADAFKRQVYPLKDALAMLDSKNYKSVALPRNFSLSAPFTKTKDSLLFFWDVPVAKVNKDGKPTIIYEAALEAQIRQVLEA